jgi:hypothetical protein
MHTHFSISPSVLWPQRLIVCECIWRIKLWKDIFLQNYFPGFATQNINKFLGPKFSIKSSTRLHWQLFWRQR